ncbi:MAG: hypothetical protein INF41_06055 [Rhodospirillaceae bacterium]|jgi:hypothetical protein|nr:hypothetical protein [Rhodospirillaceae bacterium]
MSPSKEKIIEPTDTGMEDITEKLIKTSVLKQINNNNLTIKNQVEPAIGYQYTLDIDIEIQKVIDGVEMGVLENGIPYLTQSGLAAVCGIARSVVYDISQDWAKNYNNEVIGKDRNSFLKDNLFKNGYREPTLYIETESINIP